MSGEQKRPLPGARDIIYRLPVNRPAIGRRGGEMKKEDRYLLLVIGFIIGWIALMGMGVLG